MYYLTLRPQPIVLPLTTALDAFFLSREAMRCTPKTLTHHCYTCGRFAGWLREHAASQVGEITAHHIRAYLVSLQRSRELGQFLHQREDELIASLDVGYEAVLRRQTEWRRLERARQDRQPALWSRFPRESSEGARLVRFFLLERDLLLGQLNRLGGLPLLQS